MTKEIKIEEAKLNEVAQLAAIANGTTICDFTRLNKAAEIVEYARHYNSEPYNRDNRPVNVRKAWGCVARSLHKTNPKPFDDELPKLVKSFFEVAVRAGYSIQDELADFLGVQSDLLYTVATISACSQEREKRIREEGRKLREARKAAPQ